MEILSKKIEIKYEKDRPGDIKHSFADISKAESAFNFKNDYNLKTGLEETIKWFQKNY